ncbi:hypothetical protein ABK040_016169 [Willaertia magna]
MIEQKNIKGVQKRYIIYYINKIIIPNSEEFNKILYNNLNSHQSLEVLEIYENFNRIVIFLLLKEPHCLLLDNGLINILKSRAENYYLNNNYDMIDVNNIVKSYEICWNEINNDIINKCIKKILLNIKDYNDKINYLKYIQIKLRLNKKVIENSYNKEFKDYNYILEKPNLI